MRAQTAVARTKQPSSAAVRTNSWAPIETSERMRSRSGARLSAGARSSTDDERDPHPGLRDHGAPRRPVEAPVEAVDEQHLEHDVHDVRGDDDHERRAQVADAAQPALAGERDQRARDAERRRSAGSAPPSPATSPSPPSSAIERCGERRRRRPPRVTPTASASHSACEAERVRRPVLPRAVQPRHARGRPVRQEDAERDERWTASSRPARAPRAAACRGGRRSRCRRAGTGARPRAPRARAARG